MIRPEEAPRPLTVTELAKEIQRELRPLTAVLLKGEVTGVKRSAAGIFNFTIQDGFSKIEAVLFADNARRVTTLPEDGQVFVFRGRIDFYNKTGRLSFNVDQIEFDDVGKLRARLEELKRRLEAEGAFDPKRKRPLPFLPRAVALLTSPTGAVIHDLQETIWERYPNMGVVVYPVQVQGNAAPGSISRALRRCNSEALADVLIIARGGGSFEEMFAFNNEVIARAILASRLPVVTALGHTSDRTVADMVADAECRTPTEAGARVVPKKADLVAQLRERGRRLDGVAVGRVDRSFNLLASRRATERLDRALTARFASAERSVEHRRERLIALSPDSVLARGYSITQDAESGAVVTAAAAVKSGGRVRISLASGRLGARVDEVEP